MIYPALVTLLTCCLQIALLMIVGSARDKFGVPAPATQGNIEFEKRLRAQINTTEQVTIFLPALWIWVLMLEKPMIGAIIGAVWLVSRVWYVKAYVSDAKKRAAPFILGAVCTIVLLLGGFWGVIARIIIS